MKWIYLAPHLDDAAYSCGGRIWEQTRKGDIVEVWTLFAGDPPEGPLPPFAEIMHMIWETGRDAFSIRRAEDEAACRILGAIPVHFPFVDCIYRRDSASGEPLVQFKEDLSAPYTPAEGPLLQEIIATLQSRLPPDVLLACPLTLGNHRDHQLTRAAAEALHRPLRYYADYPYSEETDDLQQWIQPGWEPDLILLSDTGIRAWQDAIAAHSSQLSSFWISREEMETTIAAHAHTVAGNTLWASMPSSE